MKRVLRVFALGSALATMLVAYPATANAEVCSATKPGILTFDSASGVVDSRVKLTHGQQSRQKQSFQFKVTGCDAGALQLMDAEVRNLRDANAVGAVLVAKASDTVSLELDFKESSLAPGKYELIVVSKSAAAPLAYPVNVDVRDSSPVWPILSFVGALVLGSVILALRAISGSVTRAKVRRYFRPAKNILVVLAGIGAMVGLLVTKWLNNTEWFGEPSQVVGLATALFGAMVATTTASTAVSGSGKQVEE